MRLKKTETLALMAAAVGLLAGVLVWGWTDSGIIGFIIGAAVAAGGYQALLKQIALETIVDNKTLPGQR